LVKDVLYDIPAPTLI